MAGSSKPGSLTPPLGVCAIPARTPGSLGINDQGDPNLTTLLGDTPGSLGVCDAGDPTLLVYGSTKAFDNLVCQADDGFLLALGFKGNPVSPAQKPDQGTVSLDDAQVMALQITTYFEGGKSMNYQALTDDRDHQATSFGLIQWNFNQGTLGPLLKKMLDKDATAFANSFGPGAEYETLKTAILAGHKADQCKWARDRIKNDKAAWKAAFTNLGAVAAFNEIQLKEAKASYHPIAVAIIKNIRKISPTLFIKVEFRTYAAAFDLGVQQGGIHKVLEKIKKRVKDEKPATQLDVMKIVVVERGKTAVEASRADCVSRRMGILTGSNFKSTESAITVTRKNPQLTLIGQFGAKSVNGL